MLMCVLRSVVLFVLFVGLKHGCKNVHRMINIECTDAQRTKAIYNLKYT